MATLTLAKVWINRVDSGAAVSAFSAPDRPRSHGLDGQVRTYAGGRQRAYASAGEHGQFAVTLRSLTTATVDLLRTWQALPVQVRDHRGLKLFGVFFDLAIGEWKDNINSYDVSLTLKVVTVVEGV